MKETTCFQFRDNRLKETTQAGHSIDPLSCLQISCKIADLFGTDRKGVIADRATFSKKSDQRTDPICPLSAQPAGAAEGPSKQYIRKTKGSGQRPAGFRGEFG